MKKWVFISSSKDKIKHYQYVFAEKDSDYLSDIKLEENQLNKNIEDMLKFKFESVKKDNRYLEYSALIIEDTILLSPQDSNNIGRKIGELISKIGLKKTIKIISEWNQVFLESNVCVFDQKDFYFFTARAEGRFVYSDSISENSSLENYFAVLGDFLCKPNLLKDDYPRVKAFRQLKDFLYKRFLGDVNL